MIPERVASRLTGREGFKFEGKQLDESVSDFWSWSASELLGNAQRGILAEFIVAMDLGVQAGMRREWDVYDLVTSDGVTVEVKSASYLQSWEQSSLSRIVFSVKPTQGWSNELGTRDTSKKRQADAYVFCVLDHKDMNTVDPVCLDQWDFYVTCSDVLDASIGSQKTLTLGSLVRLEPLKCRFGDIGSAIERAVGSSSCDDA